MKSITAKLSMQEIHIAIIAMKLLIVETGKTDLTIDRDMAALTDRILKLRKQMKESAW